MSAPCPGGSALTPRLFVVDPARSGLVIEARSTVGQITFGTDAVDGLLEAVVGGDGLCPDPPPRAELTVDLRALHSGNALYDAELAHRLDVRRYPLAQVRMTACRLVGDRFQVEGDVTIHGVTQPLHGSVTAEPEGPAMWILRGEQAIDIRDYDIPVPSALMFRIFPDVRVVMHLELRDATGSGGA